MTETGVSAGSAHGIEGHVDPGFEAVRDAFVANFTEQGELGAGFALYVEGRKVVDLWGGIADRHAGAPYTEDTLQLVFSTTKGMTALCAHLLAQRGQLDFDAPVATYWPEFAAAGKEAVTVRQLISHQAGLPYVEAELSLDEVLAGDPPTQALAAQAPIWEPGSAYGYHAVTFGWLVGEVVRRISGKSLGTFLADEVAGPLGLDMWIGLPDDQQHRVARLSTSPPGANTAPAAAASAAPSAATPGTGSDPAPGLREILEQLLGPDSLLLRALDGVRGIFTTEGIFNRPEVRAAEMGASNGVTNARSLAKLYAATVGTVEASGPLLTPEQLAAASTVQVSGPDRVLMVESSFGLGYQRSSPTAPYGGAASFGHAGAGGSLGFADPVHQLGFGYVMNRMMQNLTGDPRTRALVEATYAALGAEPAFV